MSDKIEKILNSIKGIKPADVKPYFYTRLSTKLDNIQNKEVFYLKYERPFLIMLVAVMMALNLFFITNNNSNTNNSFAADIEELYFESNQNDILNLTSNED
tara:strand:- start:132 stop:434 length:303 start_codon:yes stop_codon:yes gene_type:complete